MPVLPFQLSSTEIYNDIRQAFEEGPELPRGSSEHCLIRLGVASTRFMFVGGNPLDTVRRMGNSKGFLLEKQGENGTHTFNAKYLFYFVQVHDIGSLEF